MAGTNPTGKAVLHASFQLFRQDRQMIWLPVMATVTSLIAYAVITLPLVLAIGHTGFALLLSLACGTVVASAATVIFNVGLVFAATDRIEGRTPTIGGSLSQAWGRKGVIFQWAVLAAVVGTVIRALESRLGIFGRLLGFAGGLAWVVATYLVIPVLAFENVGPIEAVKRSSSVLKSRFGTITRSGIRFGVLFGLLSIVVVGLTVVGVIVTVDFSHAAAIFVAVLGFALLIGINMYASAAGMYMRTILYRVATDQPIPDLGVNVVGMFGTR
jgi:Family of unknown function (DUF6159)